MTHHDHEYEEVSGIKMGKRKVPPYLKTVYLVLIIWAVGYALFMPGKLVESSSADVSLDRGKQIYEGTCLSCHATGVAPDLKGVTQRYKPEEIENIINKGRNTMPALGQRFNEADRKSVVQYLETIK